MASSRPKRPTTKVAGSKKPTRTSLATSAEKGLLCHREQYLHEYPFCWRAEQDPLIQYPAQELVHPHDPVQRGDAREQRPDQLAARAYSSDGRFGNFLESNVDWALSRERYWGTPLPIWVCSETGKMEAIGSYDELLEEAGPAGTEVWDRGRRRRSPRLPDDLKVHKPYIDSVTYDSPYAKGARMRRVTEVIDCWYDSGAMPFAAVGLSA